MSASTFGPEAEHLQFIATLRRMNAESDKFVAEQRKLIAESEKFAVEQRKLNAEARKFDRDRWLAPSLAVAGLLGGVATIGLTVAKALHWVP